ncbi:MAG: TolC family protein [Flavobacteriales bacterium]|nr:TolC family protein [Flavobacteriia bacterium]NCP06892.1 TolC family protein [Flavobacteriales bacterium]PIV93826.1 MAG: transporter [Flavobacteriaceae bacterium CG17_big_fil_post_rev_8_21_14_2_50_33_15]PIY12316.1 MAG: transporter [Flavobacteriaceae bacterium CG_4_10_14_3_um_filter_33_47]NCP52483.1 TolC family protein [Flavobacteriales bacterium]
MKNNIGILTLSFLSFISITKAQEVIQISKATVLESVSNNNQSIKISKEDFNLARADYRQTNAIFLPNIAVSHTGMAITNPIMAFGSKLNQEILTVNDFNPSSLNNPEQTQNFATRIEVKQPLINMDGFYQRKAAKNNMEAMSLQTKRTTDYLVFEVDKAYMQLQLAYKALDVIEKALLAAESNKALADNSFKQGYLQQADVLAVEVRVTEVKNQLQTAKSNVENASNYLSFLMNDYENAILKPTDSLTINATDLVVASQISTERSDIKAMQLASNAYETLHKADNMTFLPTLNAFGSYELYDDQAFQGDASGYVVGAQLSWTLLDGTKRFGKAQKSKAEFEKSKLQYEQYVSQSQLELNKAKRLFMDAENKLKLSKLAMEQSHESLRIRTNRFEQGLEKTSDLLTTETQFAQKQLEYYQTIFEYNYAQAYLKFLTK